MINFRFHLVSLTAVFLALGIGIAIGATVVDQATVDLLEDRLEDVRGRVNATDAENNRLSDDIQRWAAFSEQAAAGTVAGRLAGTPVLILAVRGIDGTPLDQLRQMLAAAGAQVSGTVWFTDKLALKDPTDVERLAQVAGVTSRAGDVLLRSTLSRVVTSMIDGDPPGLLPALRDAGFVEFEPAPPAPTDLAALPLPDSRFVVVSSDTAAVADARLAVPLVGQLARSAGSRVLAAEAAHEAKDDKGDDPPVRAAFVGLVREDGELAAQISTVDNIEDFRGRYAAVAALRDLSEGKIGHYGLGSGARRLVPELTQ